MSLGSTSKVIVLFPYLTNICIAYNGEDIRVNISKYAIFVIK